MRELVRAGGGAGSLDAGDLTGSARAEHPVCGDLLQLDVRVEAGQVVDLAWQASGCPATLAVAAIAADCLPGVALDEAEQRFRDRLAQLGGLARHEQHAERMLLSAFRDATESSR